MALGILESRLKDGPLVLDGGLATELGRRGVRLDHPLWSAHALVENPETIAQVTLDFAEAGADILATATYQATFPGLEKIGIGRDRAVDLFQDAVRLVRQVADRFDPPRLVAASIGPYGAYLADGSEYSGRYGLGVEDLKDFHRERLAVLDDSAADLFAFETFPSAPEARAVSELMTEFPAREAWVSFSCRDEERLWDGTPIEEALRPLARHPQIPVVGVNCVDPRHAAGLIARIRAAAPGTAVIVYPNAGRGWDAETGAWRGEDTPEEFAERARGWRAAGAAILGGCCQAGPAHIRSLAGAVKSGRF